MRTKVEMATNLYLFLIATSKTTDRAPQISYAYKNIKKLPYNLLSSLNGSWAFEKKRNSYSFKIGRKNLRVRNVIYIFKNNLIIHFPHKLYKIFVGWLLSPIFVFALCSIRIKSSHVSSNRWRQISTTELTHVMHYIE